MCVCVLLVTCRANGIVLYMYEGKVLMDIDRLRTLLLLTSGSPVLSPLTANGQRRKGIVQETASGHEYDEGDRVTASSPASRGMLST